MWPILLVAVSVLLTPTTDAANDTLYTITAPNAVRPFSNYTVQVFLHEGGGGHSDVTVVARLTARNTENPQKETFDSKLEAKVKPGVGHAFTFPLGSLKEGDYTLNVSGKGAGLDFTERTSIRFNGKKSSVFIQTDKAIYRGGQTVMFRVLAVNFKLVPISMSADVFIYDAENNRIKQWPNTTVEKGVVSNSLSLSQRPVLGNWRIEVVSKKETTTKYFTVEEYVLPTFEVKIEPSPSYFTFNYSDVRFVVKAQYTYGQPVKGKVFLNVSDEWCPYQNYGGNGRGVWSNDYYCQSRPYVVDNLKIDGDAVIAVDLVRELNLTAYKNYQYGNRNFKIVAIVTEELSKKQRVGTATITIYQHRVKMTFPPAGSFKPGLPFTQLLKVAYQDDTPVSNAKKPVNVTITFSSNLDPINKLYKIPANGIVVMDVKVPVKAQSFQIQADYDGVTAYGSVTKAPVAGNFQYIQLSQKNKVVRVGDVLQVDVLATSKLEKPLFYQVVARGSLVFAKEVAGSSTTSQTLKLTVTEAMAPSITVIVYYVTSCKNLIADAITINVEGLFRTPVSLGVNPNRTEPGNDVEVTVKTRPNAFVAILAIDKSVLLLKGGNDVTQKQVIDDLHRYDTGSSIFYNPRLALAEPSIWRPWFRSNSILDLFQNAGLVVFTNFVEENQANRFYPAYGGGGIMYNQKAGGFASAGRLPNSNSNMDMESSYDSNNQAAGTTTRIRTNFAETWLWVNETANGEGVCNVKAAAPDTITSFEISAFALHQHYGLGITPSTSQVTVFRKFFIYLNLPYSVVRNEVVPLQVIVYNYDKQPVTATVKLSTAKQQFKLVKSSTDTVSVQVPAEDGVSTTFYISPIVRGYIDVKVTAVSPQATDGIEKKLLVKAEGIPRSENTALLIDLRNAVSDTSSFDQTVQVVSPADSVEDSQTVEVSCIGDLLGPATNNINNLLQMPGGCGEQNMLHFVPDIVIFEYLKRTDQLNDEIKTKALSYMEKGYQTELTYKRFDGSFSAFGSIDTNGSTWLTAFVIRYFKRADKFITIDPNVVNNGLEFLKRLQRGDGSFPEYGNVIHKAMQGASSRGLALSAYVTAAFLEIENPKYTDVGTKAVKYLESQLATVDDVYDTASLTYALTLAKSAKKDEAFDKLQKKAIVSGDKKYWSKTVAKEDKNYYSHDRNLDIEVTSYAVLVYKLRNDVAGALPSVKWLVAQQNKLGGYDSTQDTVMAIQALASIASELANEKDSNVQVQAAYGDANKTTFTVNKANSLVLQTEQLPDDTRQVKVHASGKGVAICQVSWSYNVKRTNSTPAFLLTLNATNITNGVNVQACASYEERGRSNMALLEVYLPSGYVADGDSLPRVNSPQRIKKVETADGSTRVIVYFDWIQEKVCVNVKGNVESRVEKTMPALVKVYDYYAPDKMAEALYSVPM